jgi:hypothetical protein
MTTQTTVKSGKGAQYGQVSELTTIFTIKPGHTEQMRQACEHIDQLLRALGPDAFKRSGLREWRQAIFDNGQRILLATSFETDWDPYIDDTVLILQKTHLLEPFANFLSHTVEGAEQWEELTGAGKAATTGAINSTALKALLQKGQAPACAFFDVLSARTVPEIRKAQRVHQAFEQVIEDPAAAQALAQPGLKPLMDEAAD